METFSMLLALCAGNSPVPGEYPSQRPVTRSLMFSLIWPWTNGWDTSDLLGHRTNYDVTAISETISEVVIPSCQFDRLLHSLSLVAVGLSVGYEIWSTISWHWHIAFAWSKYRFRNASVAMESWLTWPVRIFQRPLTVPFHSDNGIYQLPPVTWSPACCHGNRWNTTPIQFRADSRFATNQSEMALLCNDIFHWLGAGLVSAQQLI